MPNIYLDAGNGIIMIVFANKKGVGKGIGFIDKEDFNAVKEYTWFINNNGYIVRQIDKIKQERMHRMINKTPDGMETDHINHNTLDNRRSNLRTCNRSQNNFNRIATRGSSKFKGVRMHKGSWVAHIEKGDDYYWIGSYKSEIEAALAYNAKAVELFGEFACLNQLL